MLKKIILSIIPLLLISCQENDKLKVQDLLMNKDYVNAKVLNKELLEDSPLDAYYNGSMAYIMSIECLSKKCFKNDPNKLKTIKSYLLKSKGLAKVDQTYYIDFYAKTMDNLIKLSQSQTSLENSVLVLKDFTTAENKRSNYIYRALQEDTSDFIKQGYTTKALINTALTKKLNFNLSKEQLDILNFMEGLYSNKSISVMQEEVIKLNKEYTNKILDKELLITLAPSIFNYLLENNPTDIVNAMKKTVEDPGYIFGERIHTLEKQENKDVYAKSLYNLTKSENLIKEASLKIESSEENLKLSLENLTLTQDLNNIPLWDKYIDGIIKSKDFTGLYKNINIDILDSKIVISNNNKLISYSEKFLNEGSIIPILNEVIFRDDANKDYFVKKTVNTVEKALRVEITKNNLDGIFEYLNYLPESKDKFKGELSDKIETYINKAWDESKFKNLDSLLDLYTDVNEDSKEDVLSKLFEEFLNKQENIIFFKADDIQTLVDYGRDDNILQRNMTAKYNYIKGKIRKEQIQTIIYSVSKQSEDIYTTLKMVVFFSDVFTANRISSVLSDNIEKSTKKDNKITLVDMADLGNFLIKYTKKLPNHYIEKQIMTRIKSLEDLRILWEYANSNLKKELNKYNIDIKKAVTAAELDEDSKVISAAKEFESIKNKDIKEYIEDYKNEYMKSVKIIEGYYIKTEGDKGPEVIEISKSDKMLKINVSFISKLGAIENLTKYKLDRGEVVNKEIVTYYNFNTDIIKINLHLDKKLSKIFTKNKTIKVVGNYLQYGDNKYKKVEDLVKSSTKYGVIDQTTQKTKDNFHILPIGASFKIIGQKDAKNYTIKINHPAGKKPIMADATFDPETLIFSFGYNYNIKTLNKNFSALVKCQILDDKAYCASQNKHWKREKYSVLVKAVEVE